MDLLHSLFRQVGERCAAVAEQFPAWPCRRGCDLCCRRLAAIPRITEAEWQLIAPLPTAVTRDGFAAMHAAEPPYTCPLLSAGGACTIYEVRPLACRTLGFYREREAGLHCSRITGEEPVVWGNAEALRTRAAAPGEERPVTDYFASHRS